MSHLQLTAEQRGARVLSATCTNMIGSPPLWPWREILSQLPDSDEIGNSLDQMLPEVGVDESSSESDSRRFKLFSGVLSALRNASTDDALLICIDDMQWADTASQDLFSFVASQLGSSQPGQTSVC